MEKGMKCESVTFFTALGEDDDGVQRYHVTRVDGVAVFRRGGVRRQAVEGAARGDDRAVLYVFERALRMKRSFVEEDVFDEMGDREDVWTVHTDGRDRVVMGLEWGDAPPPDRGARVLRPVSVTYNDQGRRGMAHVRIVCA